jgi:CubicO group peptidase (beta-lactamase class C family)
VTIDVSIGYVPSATNWKQAKPDDVGMSAEGIQEAIRYHTEEVGTSKFRDGREILGELAGRTDAEMPSDEPYAGVIGPIKRRGPENGAILRHGYLVAEWGNTWQIDMTYSVAKSYLATMAGLALDRGLIRNVNDRVGDYVVDGSFDSEHNSQITWKHLLHQSSEWEGSLWGKPDWCDRPEMPPGYWHERELQTPGSRYKYNDVRVNLLALCLTHVWRRPLAQVCKEFIMDPIQASPTWRWNGYFNSWIELDGLHMQVVSGGSHWGGGFWSHTRDHLRFGLLNLRRGNWGSQQLISDEWYQQALAPSETFKSYGYMWWLNTDHEQMPSAPESAFAARGMGANIIYIDPENDLVAMTRWIDSEQFDGFVKRLTDSLK